MDLFRVFDWDGLSLGDGDGGPLFAARDRQGDGRHDNPIQYGACYCSRAAVSAVAESIKPFRGRTVTDGDFARPNGRRKALVALQLDDDARLVDLDDPRELASRQLRPSQVATLRRVTTQRIAASLFKEGAAGFSWWSMLDAEWTNVTLFQERVLHHVVVAAQPATLSTGDAEVRQAAAHLGIDLD